LGPERECLTISCHHRPADALVDWVPEENNSWVLSSKALDDRPRAIGARVVNDDHVADVRRDRADNAFDLAFEPVADDNCTQLCQLSGWNFGSAEATREEVHVDPSELVR
jgi:hypothetical protein